MNPLSVSGRSTSISPLSGNASTQQTQQPFVVKSDAAARASQGKILKVVNKRSLTGRAVTIDNVISKEGFKAALGKASAYSNIKDAMMRGAYKLTAGHRADQATGSMHKSAIRLAEEYHQLVQQGAPGEQKLETLQKLKSLLADMQVKHVGNGIMAGKTAEEAVKGPIDRMIRFVDHEISQQPLVHLEKAQDLINNAYPKLRDSGASISDKLECLEKMEEHLLAANEGGVLDAPGFQKLKDVQKEIAELKAHQPLKNELEQFVKDKDKNLKHVPTRKQDPVADMRAKHQHNAFMEKAGQDTIRDLRQWRVGLDIRSFDKSTLKHVETDERTGLEHAAKHHHGAAFDDGIVHISPGPRPKDGTSVVGDPKWSSLGGTLEKSEVFKGMAQRLSDALQEGDSNEMEALALTLGGHLATDLISLPKDVQLGFVTSHGEEFKQELFNKLLEHATDLTHLADSDGNPLPEVSKFLDKAYATGVSSLGSTVIDENHLVLDGLAYTKVKQLGKGGFGVVDLYEHEKEDGTKVQIAVKSSLAGINPEEMEKGFQELSHEARMHRDASEGDPANVVGFKGALQTPDGRIMIAMESAPHGTLYDMGYRLDEAVKSGKVSPQAAALVRITLFQDLLKGMQHVQETRGMTHFDIKGPNFLIGENGVAKVADFGTGATGLERVGKRLVDNPIYLAPEILIQDNAGKRERSEAVKRLKEGYKAISEKIKGEKPNLQEKDAAILREDLQAIADETNTEVDRIRSQKTEVTANEKADTWSAGVTAYELFFGELPFDSDFLSKIEDAITKFANDPTSRISVLGKDGDGDSVGTGVTQLDRLLNQMLHPVPEERPTISDLLKHSLFSEPGVGDQGVRDLIMLLADPSADPGKLKQASDALGI